MVAAIQGDSGREKIKDFLVFGTGVAVAFVSNQQVFSIADSAFKTDFFCSNTDSLQQQRGTEHIRRRAATAAKAWNKHILII